MKKKREAVHSPPQGVTTSNMSFIQSRVTISAHQQRDKEFMHIHLFILLDILLHIYSRVDLGGRRTINKKDQLRHMKIFEFI